MISSSLLSSCCPEPLVGGLIEIADAGVALLGQSGAGGKRKLAAAAGVQLPELGHPPQLLGVASFEVAELVDLEGGEPPVAGIDIAAGFHVLVEDETGERGLGARDVAADVADDERDVVGVPFRGKRPLARVVGEFDHEHHGDEDQGRDQARGRGSAPTPVEADVFLVPSPHGDSLAPLTFWRNPKVPCRFAQLMQPVARPAAANMPRISPTWSSVWRAQSEQRSSVIPAGVAGGRARLT